jgi:hypothetical protein
MSKEIVVAAKPEDLLEAKLTDFERTALAKHRSTQGEKSLSPTFQAELYGLFLAGVSCEDIVKANPGTTLGQVVEARLNNSWDARRDRYIDDLMVNAKSRVQQIQLEALEFLRTSIAVAHRAFGQKAQKFLQTGAKKDFPDFAATGMGWKQYKEQLELLLKLTGQAPVERRDVSGTVTHEHVIKQEEGAQPPAPTLQVMTPQAAAEALAALENKRNQK